MTAPAAVVPAKPARSPITVGHRGVELRTIDDMFRVAEAVVQAGLAPKGMDSPQKVFIAIQWGAELGLTPMQSIQALPIVNGRPVMEVQVGIALVLSSGLLTDRHERFEGEGLQRRCVVALVRKGGMAIERTFSVEDARRAGLDQKPNWKGFPDRMLYARAMGYAMKDLFPDVLRGIPLANVDDFVAAAEDEPRNVTPRNAPGPDPLLSQLLPQLASNPGTIDLGVAVEPQVVLEGEAVQQEITWPS